MARLVASAAECEPNTPGAVKSSASDYTLAEIEDFLENAARLDWSPLGDWIAYDKRETDGYSDMYRIRPDGTDNECLTCNHPDLPNKNTGNPAFHPDGRWLLFQAEKQNHEWSPATNPGGGTYNDLYVMDLESESPYAVYQLTDVRSSYPVGGSLHAHFSHDGEQLLWGDLEGGGGCYGDWRIAIADFDDQDPELSNVTYYQPGDHTEWYEMEDWSLDDSGIYFSCAPLSGQDDRTMGFCYLDLETEELTRLTETSGLSGESDEWDEHGKITPAGDAITWMTSTGYEIDHSSCKHIEWLETDLWIMDTDGAGKTKLTHYNEPGYPEYDPDGVCVSDMSWNPEGTKLAVEVYFRGIQTPKMKIFHFSRCGDGVCDGPETAETCPQDCGKDYQVVSITTLTTDGGRVDWSHDGQWVYYDHFEPDGFYDVYRIHPDGTGNECVTCDRPELPNGNQGQPQTHPNGRYLVFQAEKAEHTGTVGGPATGPGGGYYNDLWALDFETGSFHQLTDVRSGFPAGGSLHSHFSNDGARLLWSDLEGPGGRFGDWQLAVADFVPSPTPHLENHQYYNPGPQPIWLEAHGWGPDDSWIYFTCTPVAGMDDNNQDICRMDFSNPSEVTRLTFTSGLSGEPGEWDEHAHLSPLNDAFSWMSSTPYGTESIGDYRQWLRTELWLMNIDGSNQQRITFFNETEQVIVADNDWNPSAVLRAGPAATGNQQLAVTMFMRDRNETHIKIIEFSVRSPQYEVYLPLVVKG
jgi:Tol biopolymer transport system component